MRFIAKCPGDAPQVLERSKQVLKAVNENSLPVWPPDDRWPALLPEWFVDRCGPEMSQEEAEAWLAWWKALPDAEQKRVEADKAWSLFNWIYWLDPENRQWYWWDGLALDENNLVVAVEVDGWPFGWGDLSWLLRAAGATQVDPE